jgi:hypothetical protein
MEDFHFRFTYYLYKRSLKPKQASKDCLTVSGSDFSHIQYIPFILEENHLHQCFKPVDPSKASNPHRFGPPTDTPRWHRHKDEEDANLHIEHNKSKA